MLHLETVATATLELLKGLQGLDSLRETRLVGGTALSLQYGHRISVDLDLFAYNLDAEFITIISEIKNKGYKIDIRKQSSNILISMIENIKVDIVNYPYPWIDNKINEESIVLATDKDIAAMKLSAITNRGTKKDFIDLFYLLKSYSLEQILSFYTNKYGEGSVFMVLKSLTYFDDAEIDISPNVLDLNINWTTVKNAITNEVKRLA
jgi:predicted nucleotidyltransferase component of viral defense system